MPIRQPCIECGTLTTGTRCPTCDQPRLAAKNAKRAQRKKETGQYSGDYQRRAKQVRATATHCWLCGQPFQPSDRIEADHVIAGNPDSILAAAHRQCNARRGNRDATPGRP